MMYKISILDDHPMVIEGLSEIIQTHPQYQLAASYSNIRELKSAFSNEIPDVLFLDLQLPDGKGVNLADELIQIYPQLKIIVITSIDYLYLVKELLSKGCRGYLVKSEAKYEDVLCALEKVLLGGVYLPQNIHKELMKDIVSKERKENSQLFLSMRDKQIIQLIIQELTSKEIGEKLFISIKTVEIHRTNIYHKLKVSNMAQLYEAAQKLGII